MKTIIIAISLLFSTVVPGYAFDERHDPIPEQRPITRALTAIGECTPESSIIVVSAGETKGFHKFCKEALYVNFSNGRVLVLFNPPDNLKNEPSVGLSGLPAAGDLPAVHIDHMKVGDLEVDASGLCVRLLHNQIICDATFVKNDGDVGLVSMIMKYKVFIDVTKELAN